jgi:DNA primase
VVEGYMDVIACQRAGVAAVAGMGTALTEEQMGLMWRLHAEPTLCFDGDAAGQRAASRVIDRALPLIGAGKSFNFAILKDGNDPDDLVREGGAAALKAAIGKTTIFARMLLDREVRAEPIERPEQLTSLYSRLASLAAQIKDPHLSRNYSEQLREAVTLWWRDKSLPQDRVYRNRPRNNRRTESLPPMPASFEGKAAARRLHLSLDPMAAAVAKGALDQPAWLDDRLEAVQVHGLGHTALNDLAHEIIRLRLEADVLDSEALKRHLATSGYGALLGEIDRAAPTSGAPFLNSDVSPADARLQWSLAFEILIRMAALEAALSSAKADLTESADAAAFMRLKGERDALKRAIKTGTVWASRLSIGAGAPE